jgi:putative two-component system response regulator
MKILAVDDDDIILDLVENTLQTHGHVVIRASNGAEALELLKRQHVRLIVSDWMMPVMDGLELCKRVRAGASPWYTYIILLTGRNDHESAIAGLSAGADEFIAKPFTPVELAVRVATGERILSLETHHLAIFALAKLAESRDPETGHHLERMREYTRSLAAHMASAGLKSDVLTSDYILTLYQTSPLHDIGKVGIPDSILLKPGRLSDAEFQIMKTHTVIGGRTLSSLAEQNPGITYLKSAADIAMYHHERFNGTGYPAGLKGSDIPFSARIVALADVYDAIVSKRVYKEAYDHEVARGIIMDERGKHFDPEIVDAFALAEDDFISISHMFSDAGDDPEQVVEEATTAALKP